MIALQVSMRTLLTQWSGLSGAGLIRYEQALPAVFIEV